MWTCPNCKNRVESEFEVCPYCDWPFYDYEPDMDLFLVEKVLNNGMKVK